MMVDMVDTVEDTEDSRRGSSYKKKDSTYLTCILTNLF